MSSEVVVIGAGPGGASCALYLVRLGVTVTLISENIGGKQNYYQTIHGLSPNGGVKAAEYVDGLRTALTLAQKGNPMRMRLCTGRVSRVHRNEAGRFLVDADRCQTLHARYVVIATGSSTDMGAIPSSIKAEALTFEDYPFEKLGSAKRVLVLGAGYSASEMIQTLEANGHRTLVLDLDSLSHERLPSERREVFNGERCSLVFDKHYRLKGRKIEFARNGSVGEFEFDHVLACTGERVNTAYLPSELLNPINQRMTIVHDPTDTEVCMSDKWDGLYAIGDIRDEKLTSFIACAQADGIRVAQSIQQRILNGD